MASPRFDPANSPIPPTSSDRLVAAFVERVHAGELKVGERLPSEEKLCEKFGASRTVVREALQQLKALGVVRSRTGSGTYIAEGRLDHLGDTLQLYSARADDVAGWTELLEMRSLIETESARRLARQATPAALAPVWQALETMRRSTGDLGAFADADVAFHEAIVNASGNRLFATVHRALLPLARRYAHATYRSSEQIRLNLAEHEAIFAGMMAQDAGRAAAAMHDHLSHSAANMVKMFGGG